jgi:hypothetical protein
MLTLATNRKMQESMFFCKPWICTGSNLRVNDYKTLRVQFYYSFFLMESQEKVDIPNELQENISCTQNIDDERWDWLNFQ